MLRYSLALNLCLLQFPKAESLLDESRELT